MVKYIWFSETCPAPLVSTAKLIITAKTIWNYSTVCPHLKISTYNCAKISTNFKTFEQNCTLISHFYTSLSDTVCIPWIQQQLPFYKECKFSFSTFRKHLSVMKLWLRVLLIHTYFREASIHFQVGNTLL